MNFSIGCQIRNIRGKESRSSFCERLGIGTTTLQRYENDERSPDIDFLTKLQKVTGYSLDYLVYGKETNLSNDEALLLEKYRQVDQDIKNKILMLLLTQQVEVVRNTKNAINSSTIGNINNIEGSLTQHVDSFIKKNNG